MQSNASSDGQTHGDAEQDKQGRTRQDDKSGGHKFVAMLNKIGDFFYPPATRGPRQPGIPTRYIGTILIIASIVMLIITNSVQFPGFNGYLQKYAMQVIAILILIIGILLVAVVSSALTKKHKKLAPSPDVVPEITTVSQIRTCTKCGTVNSFNASACSKCHEPL